MGVLDKKQVKKTAKYESKDGKKLTKEITLEELSYEDALSVNDLRQGANGFRDYGGTYKELMDKMLVNPRWDYKTINDLVKANGEDTGTIEFTDRTGEEVTLNVVFPDSQEAVNLIFNTINSDGSSNAKTTVSDMNDDVFRTKDGKPLSWDFWAKHGGAYDAVVKAEKFLTNSLGHIGFLAVMAEADSFLVDQL